MGKGSQALHVLLAVACGLALTVGPALQAQQAERQGGAPGGGGAPARVFFSAVNKFGEAVTTLKREDVEVRVDGAPQEIENFGRLADVPLRLAIMLDNSASQERILPTAKALARAFVSAVVRPGQDEAAIVSFTDKSTLEQGLTDDGAKLQRAIERVEFVPPPGYLGGGLVVTGQPPRNAMMPGSTALWDAIIVTCNDELAQASGPARRVIILITDGADTSSHRHMSEAIKSALAAGVAVYSIGIGDKHLYGVEEATLRKISERTGGRAFFPDKDEDLATAFKRIRQDLSSLYVLSFAVPPEPRADRLHKLRLEIVNADWRRQGLQLAYPESYLAGGQNARGK